MRSLDNLKKDVYAYFDQGLQPFTTFDSLKAVYPNLTIREVEAFYDEFTEEAQYDPYDGGYPSADA